MDFLRSRQELRNFERLQKEGSGGAELEFAPP